jgi:hypothetical protein
MFLECKKDAGTNIILSCIGACMANISDACVHQIQTRTFFKKQLNLQRIVCIDISMFPERSPNITLEGSMPVLSEKKI